MNSDGVFLFKITIKKHAVLGATDDDRLRPEVVRQRPRESSDIKQVVGRGDIRWTFERRAGC